jgi:hypothetical protein
MDKNLTAEIFVPTRGSAGNEGNIGTGYPVGKGLLMTARHVLFPADRDEDYPIQLRWRHPGLRDGERDWIPIDDILWQSPSELDVALIRARFPQAIDSWGFLAASKPDDTMEWASEGFAKAGGKDDDKRRPVAMKGETCSAGDTANQFELLNRAPVADDQLWQGASGSPVFVGRRIIGIIISCPENFNAGRLRATPCWKLLEDAGFRAAIGYDEQQTRRKAYKTQVSNLLKTSGEARQSLAAELNEASDALAGKDAKQQADYLAERLLKLEIESLIQTGRKAQQALQQQQLDIPAAQLSKAIRALLPGVYDFGVIQGLRTDGMTTGQGFLSLPASIHTVAEIIMAGYDGREAEYRNPDRFPRGAYCLPLSPEGGWDERGEAFQAAWDEHLQNQFCDGASAAWDEYMIGQFAGDKGSGRQRSHEQLVDLARDELEYLAESEHKTHYFLFDLPKAESARRQVIELIRTLKQRYPCIAFLNLDSNAALEREERKRFRPLSDILSAEYKELL